MAKQRYPRARVYETAPRAINQEDFDAFVKEELMGEDYKKPKEGKDQSIAVKSPKEKPAPVAKSTADRFGKYAQEVLNDVEDVPKGGSADVKKFGKRTSKFSKNPADVALSQSKDYAV
jgi:hypothetical protein